MNQPVFQRPIGVFDSGIGGLSVLAALREELPHEHFVYLADSGHAPYGEKGDDFVTRRTLAIGQWLHRHHSIKALVVACNTATAASVEALRAALPGLPVIGVEPALKPAAALTRTGHVGVLATRGTVHSERFARLRGAHEGRQLRFSVQACDGLAHAIERSTTEGPAAAAARDTVAALCARYTGALGCFGDEPGAIDTLVLGCTHYVFAREQLRALVGPQVQLIDTGAAVARQTRRMLEAAGALAPEAQSGQELPRLFTTGALAALQAAAGRWLGLPPTACTALSSI
ncbi:glutamate racemase [Pulveribacter suum]|uniref:Glutamate racemase n=1 Tax=Pulveribacter suum TaxID=2116657 RepID=A0A2P1NK12_9BURK|nr:glutamate racemase [Pulveribacter suum]AVP57408.1 glutamate racemase [Pulveribacter suum]